MISYFRKIKFVFFGTPQFAVIVLEKLVSAGLAPAAVVTNPDRPAGRDQALTPPPIKDWLIKLNVKIPKKIDILQPEELDTAFAQRLESYNADVFVVAAYGRILPKWLIEMPPRGTIGAHPSLLPKYRGATPIQSVILNGDQITGTTIFVLDEKMDHGPILAQRELEFLISNFQFLILSEKLAELSGQLLVEVLPKYVAGKIAPHPQNHEAVTYTKKFTSQDGYISLESLQESRPPSLRGVRPPSLRAEGEAISSLSGIASAPQKRGFAMTERETSSLRGVPRKRDDEAIFIERKIRALNPEPGVYTIGANGERIKLLEAKLADGKLVIEKIQRAGKKPETIKNGHWPF